MIIRIHKLLVGVLVWLAAAVSAVAEQEASKPNFLFIFTDDQSYATIRNLGNEEIRTPNLDRLASYGVSYTNAYNMGGWSGAVCVASRTCLNTGRSLWRARAAVPDLDNLAEQGQFWSQLLQAGGYDTYMAGKWHVATAPSGVFDVLRHVRPGMPGDTEEGYLRPHENDTWTPWDTSFGGFWAGGKHWTDVTADDAITYLGQAKNAENPFFMYVAFNAPHDPRQAPREFVDLYDREEIRIPENFMSEYPYKQEIGCYRYLNQGGRYQRDEKLAPWPRTPEAVQLHRQEYYAAISYLDHHIGRVLDALEASGMAGNTYVIFSADQGLAVGNHGLMGKQNLYEHSVRAPLIVAGPSIPKNERRAAMVYIQDVVPTTLELAGVDTPDYVDYHSLLPTLKNDASAGSYEAIYGAYRDLQRMVRKGDYKLIVYPTVNVYRLFDLSKDPEEAYDLAPSAGKYTAIAEDLFEKLVELQKEADDPLMIEGGFASLKPSDLYPQGG